MGTTSRQDSDFLEEVISGCLLEDSIAWIKSNLNPDDVFDQEELREWALDNGFVEE